MASEELIRRFSYHRADTQQKQDAHARVRQAHLDLANELEKSLPGGREKSIVFTKLEESMMWANAAIARTTEFNPQPTE